MTQEQKLSKLIDTKGHLCRGRIVFSEWVLYVLQIGCLLGEDISKCEMFWMRECYRCDVNCFGYWDKEEDF